MSVYIQMISVVFIVMIPVALALINLVGLEYDRANCIVREHSIGQINYPTGETKYSIKWMVDYYREEPPLLLSQGVLLSIFDADQKQYSNLKEAKLFLNRHLVNHTYGCIFEKIWIDKRNDPLQVYRLPDGSQLYWNVYDRYPVGVIMNYILISLLLILITVIIVDLSHKDKEKGDIEGVYIQSIEGKFGSDSDLPSL